MLQRVAAIAKAHGVAPARIALAWLLAVTAPIVRVTRMEQLADAVGSFEVQLSTWQRRPACTEPLADML